MVFWVVNNFLREFVLVFVFYRFIFITLILLVVVVFIEYFLKNFSFWG